MAERRTSIHGEWSSRWIFVLAATGSAVGLGNIWKFPYMVGQNGGGVFVLVYLACVAVIGIPIMMAEVMLGRRGRQSPINTMRALAEEEGRSPYWRYVGWMGMIAGFLILSFYSVIAGWTLAYVIRTASGMFEGATADGVASIFGDLVSDPEKLLAWHTLFMAMTMVVVSRGVKSGLEQAVRYLMPALFILLLVMVGYAMSTDSFGKGLEFMFKPDFGAVTGESILAAMGQAFFSLSLGMGAIMIYGSYLPQDASIGRTSITIALADTLVAVLAGLAIFPIVFANGLETAQGPSLIFKTLPIAFGQMDGGAFFGTLFFLLLVFAAWTSAISLMEPAVTWLVETVGMNRIKATVYTSGICWVLGIVTILSFNLWSDIRPLSMFSGFRDKTFFDLLDYLTSNILLPLGGLLIAIFAAWLMASSSSRDEFGVAETRGYKAWRFLVRYITPLGVLLVFLNAIDVI